MAEIINIVYFQLDSGDIKSIDHEEIKKGIN